jgi:cell division protein FtsQ
LGWVRDHTRLFALRQIDVEETLWVPPWELVERAEVTVGDDLLEMRPEEVADRVASHPRVREVHAVRTWRRSLKLEIEERRPVALLLAESPVEVAADGTVLGTPPIGLLPEWPLPDYTEWKRRGVGLPLICGVKELPAPGEALQDPSARQALEFLARIEEYGLPGDAWISEIWAGDRAGLELVTLQAGIRVQIGDGRLSRRKMEALLAVLVHVDPARVRGLDARFRQQVVVEAS